jgi:hypothetical protein
VSRAISERAGLAMQLVPKEVGPVPSRQTTEYMANFLEQLDKLVTSQLGFLAQRRLARGVRLNHAEACVSKFLVKEANLGADPMNRLSSPAFYMK